MHPKRTLVATLGPASLHLFQAIADAGASEFRLNASHLSPQAVHLALTKLRETCSVPILIDLQGAKMRLGDFEPIEVQQGESMTFALLSNSENVIPLPHIELFRAVQPGQTLRCNDDRIRFRVKEVSSERLIATCLGTGMLLPRKGVNLLEHPVHFEDLSDADVQHIEVAREFDAISFAYSFMLDGTEADWIRRRHPGARVIGKIERIEAIAALSTLATRVDEVWICRGDLGAQLGLPFLARWTSTFSPTRLPVPTLLAGQVLEHLTHHEFPTRSEVCHLHDVLLRGYAGIVLSDETAVGNDPVGATATSARLLRDLLP